MDPVVVNSGSILDWNKGINIQPSYLRIFAITGFRIARYNCIKFSFRKAFFYSAHLVRNEFIIRQCQHSNLMCAQYFILARLGSQIKARTLVWIFSHLWTHPHFLSWWTLSHFASFYGVLQREMVLLFCLVWTHPSHEKARKSCLWTHPLFSVSKGEI